MVVTVLEQALSDTDKLHQNLEINDYGLFYTFYKLLIITLHTDDGCEITWAVVEKKIAF